MKIFNQSIIAFSIFYLSIASSEAQMQKVGRFKTIRSSDLINPRIDTANHQLYISFSQWDTFHILNVKGQELIKISGAPSLLGFLKNKVFLSSGNNDSSLIQSVDLNTLVLDTMKVPAYHLAPYIAFQAATENLLYFSTTDRLGFKLWRTDGSSTGTYPIFKIDSAVYFYTDPPVIFGTVGSRLFWMNRSANEPLRLWSSDGTATGTFPVQSFDSTSMIYYSKMYKFGHGIYYYLSNGLWSTDTATLATTHIATGRVFTYDPPVFLPIDSTEYIYYLDSFQITDGLHGSRPVYVPIDSAVWSRVYHPSPAWIGSSGKKNIYAASFAKHGTECYDAISDSLHLILDANPASYDFVGFQSSMAASFDNKLYLVANDGRSGLELWRMDGTAAGYELMADLTPGAGGTEYRTFLVTDNYLYILVASSRFEFDIYRIAKGATAVSRWTATNKQFKDEWTEIITPAYSYQGQLIPEDLCTHSTDIYVALNNYRKVMQFQNNDTTILNKGPVSVVKLNKYGQLKWVADIDNNTQYFLEDLPKGITTDRQGNCILVNMAYKYVVLGTETYTTPRLFVYMTKLSADSGKVMWARVFNPSYYDNSNPWKIITDPKDNIYLAGSYDDGLFQCQGTTLRSRYQSSNMLCKFDSEGALLWATNVPESPAGNHGRYRKMILDESRGRLYLLATYNQYHTWSSCEYDSSAFFIACLDTAGQSLWTKTITGNDLNTGMTMALNTERNELLIEGKFRGHLSLDEHSLVSIPTSNCTAYLPYLLRLGGSDGHIVASSLTSNVNTYPYDNAIYNQYIYSVAAAENQDTVWHNNYLPNGSSRLMLYRKSLVGKMQDSLMFYKNGDLGAGDFSFSPIMTIDSEGYMVLIDSYNGLFDSIPPSPWVSANSPGISITRSRFPLSTPAADKSSTGAGAIHVFPNPFSDYLILQSDTSFLPYSELEVYDLSGRKMYSNRLSTAPLQQLYTGSLAAGIYVFSFRGDTKQESLKLVKF